jgi:ParB family chromosome partitioning protein
MNDERIAKLLESHTAEFGVKASRPATRAVNNVVNVPIELIRPDPNNARRSFDADTLQALADDIKRHGQMQNAVVWQCKMSGDYHLIAGERRFRACQLAGLGTLMCLVVPRELTDKIRAEMAFAENMSRDQLKPTEVAAHWKRLQDEWQVSTHELAARIGVAQSTVSKKLSLLKLDDDKRAAVDAGTLKQTAAIATKAPKNDAGKKMRGVVETEFGYAKVKRGCTLAELVAALSTRLAADATDGKAAA